MAPVFRKGTGRVILVHDVDVRITGDLTGNPGKDNIAAGKVLRQDQVPDEQAPYRDTVCNHKIACLPVHLPEAGLHCINITGGTGETFGYRVAAVFCIRQVNIHDPVKQAEGFNSIVSPGIVDNRYGQPPFSSNPDAPDQLRDDMGWRDDIDIATASPLQLYHDTSKILRRDFPTPSIPAYLKILAERAGKVAVGDKDGAGPAVADKRGLLAKVRTIAGNDRQEPGAAETPFVLEAVYTAPAGADRAGT